MRVVCFTENLVSGGAERQLVQLAIGLSRRGYDVEVIVYHSADHFRHCLEEEHIPVELIDWRNRLHRIWMICKTLREKQPDVIIAFKKKPALYAEISRLFCRKNQLIVSERNYDYQGLSVGAYIRLFFHSLADVVVTNSKSQLELIRDNAFWLKSKVIWITNAVDLNKFQPRKYQQGQPENIFRLLVLARFAEQKNPLRFIQAVALVKKHHPDINMVIDWYGSNYMVNNTPTCLSRTYLDAKAEIARYKLELMFKIHRPAQDIIPLLHGCDVLCLPSIYEGFSNVIGEAMACGKPILAGNVSDNSLMVKNGFNGFLFNPKNPSDIADAIVKFYKCRPKERQNMGKRSRDIAEKLLSEELFIKRYEKLFAMKGRIGINPETLVENSVG